jgi:hypothetical protein
MRRLVSWVLLMAFSGVAHASGGHEKWDSVEKLAVGTQVLVQAGAQRMAEFCEIVQVDDAFLTCDRVKDPDTNWTLASGARLMFARSGVKNVWAWEPANRWDAMAWTKLIVGGAAVGLGIACIAVNPLCVVPVAVVAGVTISESLYPTLPQRPRPRNMRRRLVYRAPQIPAGSLRTP